MEIKTLSGVVRALPPRITLDNRLRASLCYWTNMQMRWTVNATP